MSRKRATAQGHGIGTGDINGDYGRLDILDPYGWWEQPVPGSNQASWTYHPVDLGGRNVKWCSAIMAVYDVNGDGLKGRYRHFTQCARLGPGLVRAKSTNAHGDISFVGEEGAVMVDFSIKNAGDVTFSELHGSGVADVNGDGIPDFITGKQWYSHLDSGIDPDTLGSSCPLLVRDRSGFNRTRRGQAGSSSHR